MISHTAECVFVWISVVNIYSVSCVSWTTLSNEFSPRLAPGNRTDVRMRVIVDDVRPIDAKNLELQWIYYIYLTWNDSRLAVPGPPDNAFIVSGDHVTQIWRPDIHVSNSLETRMLDGLRSNSAYKVYQNGTVHWVSKLSTAIRCPNAGSTYPLDTYICSLQFRSLIYPSDKLSLEWEDVPTPLVMQVFNHLRSFSLESSSYSTETEKVHTEEFSSLHVRIIIKREYKMYLVQVYMPSAMLVVLSWLSFWIDRDAILARVSLGSLCVVSIITQSTGLMNVVPEVSGVRAIDVWESFCITMIFLAMLEFATMHFMCRMKKKHDHYVRISTNHELNDGDGKEKGRAEKLRAEIGGYSRWLRFRIDPAKIDHVARILFPVTFLLFNIIYWPVYTSVE